MKYRYTRHSEDKIIRTQKSGFLISKSFIEKAIQKPLRLEKKPDNTFIASFLLDQTHILRVVYRKERGIIIIITCYPGRRKAYDI